MLVLEHLCAAGIVELIVGGNLLTVGAAVAQDVVERLEAEVIKIVIRVDMMPWCPFGIRNRQLRNIESFGGIRKRPRRPHHRLIRVQLNMRRCWRRL